MVPDPLPPAFYPVLRLPHAVTVDVVPGRGTACPFGFFVPGFPRVAVAAEHGVEGNAAVPSDR